MFSKSGSHLSSVNESTKVRFMNYNACEPDNKEKTVSLVGIKYELTGTNQIKVPLATDFGKQTSMGLPKISWYRKVTSSIDNSISSSENNKNTSAIIVKNSNTIATNNKNNDSITIKEVSLKGAKRSIGSKRRRSSIIANASSSFVDKLTYMIKKSNSLTRSETSFEASKETFDKFKDSQKLKERPLSAVIPASITNNNNNNNNGTTSNSTSTNSTNRNNETSNRYLISDFIGWRLIKRFTSYNEDSSSVAGDTTPSKQAKLVSKGKSVKFVPARCFGIAPNGSGKLDANNECAAAAATEPAKSTATATATAAATDADTSTSISISASTNTCTSASTNTSTTSAIATSTSTTATSAAATQNSLNLEHQREQQQQQQQQQQVSTLSAALRTHTDQNCRSVNISETCPIELKSQQHLPTMVSTPEVAIGSNGLDGQALHAAAAVVTPSASTTKTSSSKKSFLSRARNSAINLASLTTVTQRFHCSASVGSLWSSNGGELAELSGDSPNRPVKSLEYNKRGQFDAYDFDDEDANKQQQVATTTNIMRIITTTTTPNSKASSHYDSKSSNSNANKSLLSVSSCQNNRKISSSSSSSSSKDKKKRQKDAEKIEKLRLLVSYLKSGSSPQLVNPVTLNADELELAQRYKSHVILCEDCLQTTDRQEPASGSLASAVSSNSIGGSSYSSSVSACVGCGPNGTTANNNQKIATIKPATSSENNFQPQKLFYIDDPERKDSSDSGSGNTASLIASTPCRAWTNPQNLAIWIDNEVNSLVEDLEAKSQLVMSDKRAKSNRRDSPGAHST